MSRLDRADRLLGCLFWKPLIFVLVLATAGSVWMGVTILRNVTGTERWAGFVVALLAAVVFGAGAFLAARKRRLSDYES